MVKKRKNTHIIYTYRFIYYPLHLYLLFLTNSKYNSLSMNVLLLEIKYIVSIPYCDDNKCFIIPKSIT